MKDKIWLFRHKDTVKETEINLPGIGLTKSRTAEHRPTSGNFVITYGKDYKTCHIHSDVEIPELELEKENTTIEGV